MTSSATQDFLSELIRGEPVPSGKLAYFRTRLSGRVHQIMLKVFGALEQQKKLSRRDLARRIGRKPEQITRWFSYPGNLTLDTVSDIFVGMGCEVESVTIVNLVTGARTQFPEASIVALQESDHAEKSHTSAEKVTDIRDYQVRKAANSARPAHTLGVAHGLAPTLGTAESDQLDSKLSRDVPMREEFK